MSFDVVLRSPTGFNVQLVSGAVAIPGQPKVWNGSAWEHKPMKVWNGSAWVEKPVRHWNGSAWIPSPAPAFTLFDDFASYSTDQILSTSPNWTSIVRADELDLTKVAAGTIRGDNADSNPAREFVVSETNMPGVKHYVEAVIRWNNLSWPGTRVVLLVGYTGSNFYMGEFNSSGNISQFDHNFVGVGRFSDSYTPVTGTTMKFRMERDQAAETVRILVDDVERSLLTGATHLSGGLKVGFGIVLPESAQPLDTVEVLSITGDSF